MPEFLSISTIQFKGAINLELVTRLETLSAPNQNSIKVHFMGGDSIIVSVDKQDPSLNYLFNVMNGN